MEDKQKMPAAKKMKLIYCGELLVIALVAITMGVLKMLKIIGQNQTRLLIYNIVTLVGAAYILFELGWWCFSKKKRAKNSLLEKLLPLPASLYLIFFDITCFVQGSSLNEMFLRLSISCVLLYAGAISLFMAILRFFKPNKQLINMIEEAEKEELAEKEEQEDVSEKKED